MTVEEAARRLDVPAHQVVRVREHPAGHLVDLRGKPTMLVTATVARAYVPEVDDVQAESKPRARAGKASS